jgi:hypothetical protein
VLSVQKKKKAPLANIKKPPPGLRHFIMSRTLAVIILLSCVFQLCYSRGLSDTSRRQKSVSTFHDDDDDDDDDVPFICPPNITIDVCGTCNGTILNASLCVVGCNGVNGSGLVFDQCDVCGGDNSTCVCNTDRVFFWLFNVAAEVIAPFAIYAIARFFIFIAPNKQYWLVHVPPDRQTSVGDGAFDTQVANEQRENAFLTSVFVSIIWCTCIIVKAVLNWMEESDEICRVLVVSNFYVPIITCVLGAVALSVWASFSTMMVYHSKSLVKLP